MREFDFDVIVQWDGTAGDDFLDRCEATLKDAFQGDVTPAVKAGVPLVSCTLRGGSPEEAMLPVFKVLRDLHLSVRYVQFYPGVVGPAA